MEWKIKDITGAEIVVTNLRKAIRQCRDCIGSPYRMSCGYTVGEDNAYMLKQLLGLKKRPRLPDTGYYTRAKKSDDNNRPIFGFPSLNRYFFLDTKNAFKKNRFFFTIQKCISTPIHMGIFVHFIIRETFKFIKLFVEKNVFT